MSAPKRKKDLVKDGRRNNGPVDRGLKEDAQLVTGPRGLMQAARTQAAYEGISTNALWRKAVAKYMNLRDIERFT